MRQQLRLFGAAAIAAGILAAPSPASAADPAFCGLSGFSPAHTWRWINGDGHWYDASHWQRGTPPGPNDPTVPGRQGGKVADTDYVCIGGGVTVSLIDNQTPNDVAEQAGVAAIDVGQNSRVVINEGRFLFLNRHDTAQPSIVRAGSDITDAAGTLGGYGYLHVYGSLHVTAHPGAAATLTTRPCALTKSCTHATTTPGVDVIEGGGQLFVDGSPYGGINLYDRKTIDNRGTTTLSGAGYIAADWGTTVVNRKTGTILIANDGGVYEGFRRSAYETARPLLDNYGTLSKDGTSGTSVIGVRYYDGTIGFVHVHSGTLAISGRSQRTAQVDQGDAYGSGQCATNSGTPCQTQTGKKDPQTSTVALPSGFAGTAGVNIAEVAAPASVSPNAPAPIGDAVQIQTAGAQSDANRPVRLSLNFLQTTYPRLQGNNWQQAQVYRADGSGGPYRRIYRCASNGRPPVGQSCLDMRAGSSNNDTPNVVQLVIRTFHRPPGQLGRWVVV